MINYRRMAGVVGGVRGVEGVEGVVVCGGWGVGEGGRGW